MNDLTKSDREDLKALIKGKGVYYSQFNNALVKKAGHFYSDQYGRTSWNSINILSNEELAELYVICKNSWQDK